MRAIFLSFVKQKSLLKSRLERSENVENWITIYVCMRPTSGIIFAQMMFGCYITSYDYVAFDTVNSMPLNQVVNQGTQA